MTFAGQENESFETILFAVYAAIAAIMFCLQVAFLQKLKILPVFLLAVVSLCFCYENIILFLGKSVNENSTEAMIMYAVHSLEVSLLIVCIYETSYRLHEVRGANLISIELNELHSVTVDNWSLWVVRLIAVLMCFINIIISYKLIPGVDYFNAGGGGYVYLAEHPQSITIWLALLPPMMLSLVALNTSNIIARYGYEYTMGLSYLSKWKVMILAAILQTCGQIFGTKYYPVTSNGGEVALLLGMTFFLSLAQEDIVLTARFADFLRQSNEVFRRSPRMSLSASPMAQQQHSLPTRNNNNNNNNNVQQSQTSILPLSELAASSNDAPSMLPGERNI